MCGGAGILLVIIALIIIISVLVLAGEAIIELFRCRSKDKKVDNINSLLDDIKDKENTKDKADKILDDYRE